MVYNEYFKGQSKYGVFSSHPLYKSLFQRHLQNIHELDYELEHPGGFNVRGEPALTREEMVVAVPVPEPGEEKKNNDEDLRRKRQRSCDDIFADYLAHGAKKVNKQYYQYLLKFIFLYREGLNYFTPRLEAESRLLPADLKADPGVLPTGCGEFSMMNNAEQVPDISNEFIMIFLHAHAPEIETLEAVELTQNFCHWLFVNGYTCSKLSLIQDPSISV